MVNFLTKNSVNIHSFALGGYEQLPTFTRHVTCAILAERGREPFSRDVSPQRLSWGPTSAATELDQAPWEHSASAQGFLSELSRAALSPYSEFYKILTFRKIFIYESS